MSSDYIHSYGKTLVKVENLCVDYTFPVLKNVNFEIKDVIRPDQEQGQKVAIVAPSGGGKSTLFWRLAGLLKPTSGTVLIGENQKPVSAGMVGVVPQNYLLFHHLTVQESLMLAASQREKDKTKAQAKVTELLQDFNLVDKRGYYPQQLSGGQRQRVSISEQLLSSEHFLLMDEPFSGLDILSKKNVCNVIDRVASRDSLNTIIFSTHDIESAVMIADTVYILGRDHDQNNHPIPGAKIQATLDLIERNLAWHPEVASMPGFNETVAEIKAYFPAL